MMVATIAVSGLLLAGLAFFAFVRSFGRPADRAPKNPVAVNQPASTDPQSTAEPSNTAPTAEPASNPVVPNEPSLEEPTDPPSAVPNLDPLQNKTLAMGEVNGSDPGEASPLVPQVDIAAQAEPPAANPTNSGIEEKLPSVFEDFQQWIDGPSRGKWDDVGKADRTIESEIALENAEVLFREEYYPTAIPIPAWNDRSQRTLTSVKTQPMPLLRCIDWFSKISSTGIKADWLEMNLAGVDFSEGIAIEGQNATIAELLDKICLDRGLAVVVDDAGFPHIRPNQDRISGMTGPDGVLNTDKILSALAPEQRDAWVPLLIRLLDLSQCQYTQGRLVWDAQGSLYDRARFIASLQALKDAAAQPPVAIKLPNDAFDFVRPEAWWMLRERVQQTMTMERIVHEEKPVVDFLAQASDGSGTQLVIDWPAVWQHGLHPSRLSLSLLRGRTLEQVANRYLEDYSLELVPLDTKTVLLTTDAVRRSIEQVVPVRLDRGMNIEDIKAAIRSLVPRGVDQRSRFQWEVVPGNDQLALLRVCMPALIHLRDSELQRSFGFQSPNENTERQ